MDGKVTNNNYADCPCLYRSEDEAHCYHANNPLRTPHHCSSCEDRRAKPLYQTRHCQAGNTTTVEVTCDHTR